MGGVGDMVVGEEVGGIVLGWVDCAWMGGLKGWGCACRRGVVELYVTLSGCRAVGLSTSWIAPEEDGRV